MAVVGPGTQYLSALVGRGNGRRGCVRVCRHAIRALPLLLLTCLLPWSAQAEAPAPPPTSAALYGGLSLIFEANAGEMDPAVKFLPRGPGYTLFLTPTGTTEPLTLAQNFTGSSRKSPVLEVQYDPVSDRLSIRANQTPLREVLREISQKARVSIRAPDERLLSEELSVEMKNVSVEQALRQLLQGFDSVFLYSPAVDPQRGTTPLRLDKVVLFSRKAGRQTVERQSGTDPRPAAGPGAALLRAVIDNSSVLAAARVQALREPGTEREREKALEALLEALSDKNFPSHYDAIAALHQLAPEKAVAALANLVQGDDQEMRVIAATGLGQTGDERAIHPLMSALTGNDPLTRQVAANSLARIGGERATDALFQAYLAGDPGLKQAVAGAVAFHAADEKSQMALAHVIAGGPVPAGTTLQDVIASSLPRKEGHASDNEDPGLE